MDVTIWALLFIMIFMLHNLEEIMTIERWFQKTYPQVKRKIPVTVQTELEKTNITSSQFSVVVFVFSIFASALIILGILTKHYYLFLGVELFFALNIFTHPLQSLYLRCYTPGVVTSLVFIIPYYFTFFYHFYNTDLLATNSIVRVMIVMLVLIPAFFFSHKVGKKWSKWND